jgi:hypothetical protein
VLARFDSFIPFFPASLLPRRNPPQARMAGAAGKATGRASGTRAARKQAARKLAPKSAPAAKMQRRLDRAVRFASGGRRRPCAPESPHRRTGRPGFLSQRRFAQAINRMKCPP